jgi:hypothetical protein
MSRWFQRHLNELDLPSGPGDQDPATEADIARLPEPARRLSDFHASGRSTAGLVISCPIDGAVPATTGPGLDALRRAAVQQQRGDHPGPAYAAGLCWRGACQCSALTPTLAGTGQMRGKILNLIPVLNGSGREYDIGELVTYLNDACIVAPSMLLTPAATWTAVDDRAFDVTLVDRGNTTTARIFVDDIGQLPRLQHH